jgi:hypothetical protein
MDDSIKNKKRMINRNLSISAGVLLLVGATAALADESTKPNPVEKDVLIQPALGTLCVHICSALVPGGLRDSGFPFSRE